jgi:hypothetical protein
MPVSGPEKTSLPSFRPQPEVNYSTRHQFTKTPDDFIRWLALDRLDIVRSGMTQAEGAYINFCDRCSLRAFPVLTPQMFGRRFTKVHSNMGGTKQKRPARACYSGVSLPAEISLTSLRSRSSKDRKLLAKVVRQPQNFRKSLERDGDDPAPAVSQRDYSPLQLA